MTILSENLIRLREKCNYTQDFIALYCRTTQAAVTQWENPAIAYIPKIDKLIMLAGLYKTTVEELYSNKKISPGELISPILELPVLEKVFRTLDKSDTISYAFNKARVKRRSYLFTLLYSLCEEITSNYLDETEVIALMDIKNEPKKRKTTAGTRKRTTTRTKSADRKKH